MNLYGNTDIGKKREENQDCFGYISLPCGITVLAVCDGMGGALGGGTASKLALDGFLSACRRDLKAGLADAQIRSILSAAVNEANGIVYRAALANEDLKGMGTTLVGAMIPETEGSLFIINAGDSRAYMWCNGCLEQLSHDHSYVQFLIDKGDITPEEAETHPDRHVIMRAIGIAESARPDIDKFEVNEPYSILLCSDGLSGKVNNLGISEEMRSSRPVNEKVDRLIALANENGDDNITVLISEI